MLKQHLNKATNSDFFLADEADFHKALKNSQNHLKFIWNRDVSPLDIMVDGSVVTLLPNHILCCTYVQNVQCESAVDTKLLFLSFNKAFYCIHTNDAEVSCSGLLFFGTDFAPVIHIDNHEQQRLDTLAGVLEEEFETVDGNQEEML
ncbi:MAG: hypothetical protein K0B37_13405, partial [Bacteroidales bacterium]|nr:hypothetical protein [Bacteroidales bacterium]